MLSNRVKQIGLSATLKMSAEAKAMKADGIDVVDLSAGEPDFPTPENIREFAKKAIDDNFTKYTAAPGIPQLRKAVADRIREDYGLDYAVEEIIVSNGGKHSLYNLMLAVVDKGDEVIIPAPYWVSYPEMVTLACGKSVILPTEEERGFRITADSLRAAITPRTKALIFNNPSNPTGAVYSRKEMEAIAEVVLEKDLVVIADEVYDKLVYEGMEFTTFASLGEEIKQRTIVVNAVSKTYSMPGWRIGYAAGPSEIIGGMTRIQSHSTSNPCSISQMAALEALRGPQDELADMRARFENRRDFVLERLATLPDVTCPKPMGAFYVFPNVSAYYGKENGVGVIEDSLGMAFYLLKEAKVALIPGSAFGSQDCIRISYATSMDQLEEGMARILDAITRLK